MIENNLALAPNYNKLNPYSKVDTANGMPINNLRVIEPVNNSIRANANQGAAKPFLDWVGRHFIKTFQTNLLNKF